MRHKETFYPSAWARYDLAGPGSFRVMPAENRRTFQLLLVACLATGTLRAANDPFVGDWKLNPSRSKLTDQMKVQSIAANQVRF